jgi:hypothetical protein
MSTAYNTWDAAYSWFHCPPKNRKKWREQNPERARTRDAIEKLRNGRET